MAFLVSGEHDYRLTGQYPKPFCSSAFATDDLRSLSFPAVSVCFVNSEMVLQ